MKKKKLLHREIIVNVASIIKRLTNDFEFQNVYTMDVFLLLINCKLFKSSKKDINNVGYHVISKWIVYDLKTETDIKAFIYASVSLSTIIRSRLLSFLPNSSLLSSTSLEANTY